MVSRHTLPRRLLFLLFLPTLWVQPSPARAEPRLPADVYPKIFQRLPGRLEPSDFAGMQNYDIVSINMSWLFSEENGNIDSVQALRERNPEIVIMADVGLNTFCANWGDGSTRDTHVWAESLDRHAEDWLLRDTDGDLFFFAQAETLCSHGRLNYADTDMARAFAHYLADFLVDRYGDLVDGYDLDDLQSDIYWMNRVDYRMPGVDSIDTNRDGIADTHEEIQAWWGAGVDTFLATFRTRAGDDRIITVNGVLRPESSHWVNGRFHEGYPIQHGDGWEVATFHPVRGYLGGDTLYSDVPMRLSGLFCQNSQSHDPDRLSTKEEPFPHPDLGDHLRYTVAASLLGEGWYALTGFGEAVDWNGDRIPFIYQTLWWFPLYDTLRTYVGTPTGNAVRGVGVGGLEKVHRDFSGGRARIYPEMRRGILDLRPLPQVWSEHDGSPTPGDSVRVGWEPFDPNGEDEPLQVDLWLSRDGGSTFAEPIGSFDEETREASWIVDGEAGEEWVFKVVATDTSGLTGEDVSEPVTILSAPVATGGFAEIHPTFWIANTPALYCTVAVDPDYPNEGGGWDRVVVLPPADISLLSYAGAERAGSGLSSAGYQQGDTIRIDLDEKIEQEPGVTFRFLVNSPALPQADSLRFRVGVEDRARAGSTFWLSPGDANGRPDDGNVLSVTCDYGPPDTLHLEPERVRLTAGDTLLFDLSGYDQAGNSIEVDPEWALTEPFGVLEDNGFFQAFHAGSLAVIARVAGLETVSRVVIVPGPPDSVHVEPESSAVTVDDTLILTALFFDPYGNSVDANTSWIAQDSIARFGGDGLLFPIRPGSTTVMAAYDSLQGTAFVRIEAGAPDSLRLTPRAVVLSPGDTLRVTAGVWDRRGNPLIPAPVWMVAETLAVIDGAGLVTAAAGGLGWARATQGGAHDSIHIQVVEAPITATILEPVDAVITADSVLRFTAKGVSQSGDTITLSPTWFTEGGVGEIDEGGLFEPTAAGSGWVGAEADGERESTTVTVLPGEPAFLRVQPEAAEIMAGETLSVEAFLFDRLGNRTDGEVAWETDSLCGALEEGRLSCTRAGAGTVVARSGGLADTLVVAVVAAPPVSLEIAPGEATAFPGETIAFRATLTDRYGNVGESPLTWEVVGGIGEIDWAGSFTASAPGPGFVIARSGSLADSSTVSVVDSLSGGPPSFLLLSLRSEAPAYDASRWPDGIRFVASLTDTSGGEAAGEWHDSATVRIELIDTTLVISSGVSTEWRRLLVFPDTLELMATDFGGCGRLSLTLDLESNGATASDTVLLTTPDVTGDLRIDLLDVGRMLQAGEGAEAEGCFDLNGDGTISMEDIEDHVAPAHDANISPDGVDPFPEGEMCSWLSLGESRVACEGESTAARFHLYAGAADSIRALEVSFPRSREGNGEITWHPTDLWHDVRVIPLPSDGEHVRVLLIETGRTVVPAGAPLVEVRCCGASEESFAGGESKYALLGPDYLVDGWGEAVVQLLLDTEDTTTARPDTGSGGAAPPSFALLPGRPNPFRSSMTVQFLVPPPGGEVRIEVYNIHGERVALVEEGSFSPGSHIVQWNAFGPRGRSLAPGAYFLRFLAPETAITRKIILVP